MIYCASRHIVFTILPLLKKWLCLQLEVQLPLPKNALVIIIFIKDKMIWIYFFYYSVTTYLYLKARKTRLLARALLSFAKTKTVCLHSYPLTLKKLRLLVRMFLSFWYGFVVILKWCQGYLGILKCIIYYLNLKMVGACFRQANKLAPLASFWVVHATPKLHRMLPFKEVFVAPHHSYHNGEACVHGRDT